MRGGSMQTMQKPFCKASLTQRRTFELSELPPGPEQLTPRARPRPRPKPTEYLQ